MHANQNDSSGLTRRSALVKGGTALFGLSAASLLAACGSNGGGSTGTAAAGFAGGGTPVRGGTFNAGMISAGSSETINPYLFNDGPSAMRVGVLYDKLFRTDRELSKLVPQLALSIEPNADATVWTLKLRDGVTFHDGKPFGADDVVHSFRLWSSPTVFIASSVVSVVDLRGVRKRGPLTVEVPLLKPVAQFPTLLVTLSIVQAGTTLEGLSKKPAGTGPFKLTSFTPGRRTVLAANQDYWEQGKPYVDQLVIDSSFADDNARFNALLAGDINVMAGVPPLTAKQQTSSGRATVLRAASAAPQYFSMRIDKAPFDDMRVRQALRLVADRQALIDGALAGYGTVGNDLLGKDTEHFAADLVRERDVEQARSLLKAAGKEGLSVSLRSANAFPGGVESATLFKQQAKAAGIDVKLDVVTPANYFQAASGWPYPFGQDGWNVSFSSLTSAYNGVGGLLETGWDPARDKAVQAATTNPDPSKAAELWHTVQQQQFDTGGYLLWAQPDIIDAVAKGVRGLSTTTAGNLNGYRFQDGWLTS